MLKTWGSLPQIPDFIFFYLFLVSLASYFTLFWCSPGSSDSKETACNTGDLGQEDALEKGMATPSSILAWTILWAKTMVGYSPRGHKESDMMQQLTLYIILTTDLSLFLFLKIPS